MTRTTFPLSTSVVMIIIIIVMILLVPVTGPVVGRWICNVNDYLYLEHEDFGRQSLQISRFGTQIVRRREYPLLDPSSVER